VCRVCLVPGHANYIRGLRLVAEKRKNIHAERKETERDKEKDREDEGRCPHRRSFVNRFRRFCRIGRPRIDFCSRFLPRAIVFRHSCDRPIVSPFGPGALSLSLSVSLSLLFSSRRNASCFLFSLFHRASLLALPSFWPLAPVVNQDLCVPPVETFARRD